MKRTDLPTNIQHGKASTYNSYACRCAKCRAAQTLNVRAQRLSRLEAPVPAHVRHGTTNAYANWLCRCDECRAASAAYQRDRYRKKASR